ncbi:hypothetical protein P154DRAFT_392549, partial [Amniculicola lignicola CBS 123094]
LASAATTAVKSSIPIVRQGISSTKYGVVVSAGKMDKAVKVRIAGMEWNKQIRKAFPSPTHHLVSDPSNSLRIGDFVRIASGHRVSPSIRHIVTAIVSPFGAPVNERPPIPSPSAHLDSQIQARLLKDVRSAARGRKASKDRIKEARKQGIRIPSMEEAMANTRRMEREEAERTGAKKTGSQLLEGALSGRERRRLEREKTQGEREAEKGGKEEK